MNIQSVWDEIWKSFIVIFGGMLLLRLAGRKSISQMTIPTTVIMVSIGTVIVQPIANKSIWIALVAASTFVLLLITIEAIQLKWNLFERFIRSQAVVVIKDGQLQTPMLKRLRLTVDQLEMKLRQAGIQRFEDVKTATIESNGQLGYELTEEAQPVTFKQLKELLDMYFSQQGSIEGSNGHKQTEKQITLFSEVRNNTEQHHAVDKHLQ